METLGERLKKIRGSMSQAAFAARVGISKGALGGYERDENVPGTEAINKICSITCISVDWLITGGGQPCLEKDKSMETAHKVDAPANCQNCLELLTKLVLVQERENALLKEVSALQAENVALRKEIEVAQADAAKKPMPI
ncbi:MAG: helix-turn-helix domain-containing protein [Desulfovibrio sp.]|jgi:transcriptional regulator with XRE-family HTH domain|nr:helix-turn-helix domain-containing protein [Desulfovibrio sp.]